MVYLFSWPDYLNDKKIEYWDIEDPGHKDLRTNINIRDQLSHKIKELVNRLK